MFKYREETRAAHISALAIVRALVSSCTRLVFSNYSYYNPSFIHKVKRYSTQLYINYFNAYFNAQEQDNTKTFKSTVWISLDTR